MTGTLGMVRANRRYLTQGLALLDRLNDQYASRRGGRSLVGAQYRHVLEHYQCLIEGIAEERVDYDARRRDKSIEESRARAREATDSLIDAVGGLEGLSPDLPLLVQMQCDPDRGEPGWTRSTLGRELQFLVSHAVHHFALIKLLVAQDGIDLDPAFGIAPSTLSHARAAR